MVEEKELQQALIFLLEAENSVLRLYARVVLDGSSCEPERLQRLQTAALAIMQRREASIGAITLDAIKEVLQWNTQPGNPALA